MCQRPKRALFISTYAKEKERKRHEMPCVNALNGLSSFLRLKKWTQYYLAFVCQRPKRALFISTKISIY